MVGKSVQRIDTTVSAALGVRLLSASQSQPTAAQSSPGYPCENVLEVQTETRVVSVLLPDWHSQSLQALCVVILAAHRGARVTRLPC